MAGFILLLAVLLAAASVTFYSAAHLAVDGPNWASNMCSTAKLLCHSPKQMAYAAAALAALWLLMRFLSAVRD